MRVYIHIGFARNMQTALIYQETMKAQLFVTARQATKAMV